MSLLNLIGTIAPTVATALGGPLAGMAVKALAESLGVEEDRSVIEGILANPSQEDLVKIKELEISFKLRLKELEIDVYKIDAADRDSARKREMSVGGYTNPVISFVVIFGFFAVLSFVFSGSIPENVDRLYIGSLLGILSSMAERVMNYYFGSSSGSKQKTKIMGGK
tara:strand:+ start:708 stop:1208 length:501 start_codon:yes stop_codon:yes gene_type:complete